MAVVVQEVDIAAPADSGTPPAAPPPAAQSAPPGAARELERTLALVRERALRLHAD